MHASFNRRTATKVKDGRVQRKNRHRPTVHDGYLLDSESPGRGFLHVVSKRDIHAFIGIIPDWHRFSERLELIMLSRHEDDCDGAHQFYRREKTGAIFLNAWHDDLWIDLTLPYFDDHQILFDRFGVAHERLKTCVACRFTKDQARAFMLLHVFLHELEHHYDRIHQKHLGASKGEDFAEKFATTRFDPLFPAYVRLFGHPADQRLQSGSASQKNQLQQIWT